MPGSYHIIHANAQYISKWVPCQESGRDHRHKQHEEETVQAACGRSLVRDRGNFCNVITATPSWDYDWCHDCVSTFPWKDAAREEWLNKHGIETLDVEAWKQATNAAG